MLPPDTPQSVVHGISPLLRESLHALTAKQSLQVGGLNVGYTQMLVAGLARSFSAADWSGPKKIIIVLPSSKDFAPWISFVDGSLPHLIKVDESHPPYGVLPYIAGWGNDRFMNLSVQRRQRLYSLAQLHNPEGASVVITTLAGLSQTTLTRKSLDSSTLRLSEGAEKSPEDLIRTLEDAGYRAFSNAEEEGTYAVRGGLIDVYPINLGLPLRIEFIGDSIGSIRHFSPENQRSLRIISRCEIFPATEAVVPMAERATTAQHLYEFLLDQEMDQAEREGIFSHAREGMRFPGYDLMTPILRKESASGWDFADRAVLLFPSGINPCLDGYEDFLSQCHQAWEKDKAQNRGTTTVSLHFLDLESLKLSISRTPTIEGSNPIARPAFRTTRLASRSIIEGAPQLGKNAAELFDKWAERIAIHIKKSGGSVAITAHHDDQVERLIHLFEHRGIATELRPKILSDILDGNLTGPTVFIGKGDLQGHFWIEDSQLLVISEPVLFGTARRKTKPASANLQNLLSSFRDLKVGDLVVHVQHGIAKYQGLTSFEVSGVKGDFLILEYAGGDRIYVPVDRLSMLQRYSSNSEEGQAGHPSLDRLRSGSWEKRKGRVGKAVRDMAEELLKQGAKRAIAEAHACSATGEMYFQFEGEFPYEETEDQLRAIAEVNADLSIAKPMDRLICGDVGFGKTEVALRAAYRMVLDGYQVLVLVPTTVLCYQHYRTFSSRLSHHGVRVAQVNRFVKGNELKDTIAGLQDGRVDILVGTHRLLSTDIKPRKMGLLIIDEEQRFGVTHKEKLKVLRAGAHVLTLSATPIPRTLHMAMLGLREISLIATPPPDRLAVRSLVSKFDESLIRDAINHEIGRGGQVFIVHNRVEDIEEFTLYIKALVPGIEIRFAHGQMTETQLETAIVDFLEQKYAVLVCTSIIESGIDMPHVNTLIIDRSDRFGLAQLYQLKGRVGRSSEQAYAYFLTPGEERLSEEAQKRLDVLSTHQELGAGFQIASYDLELRGAGNLLGGEQSGHVSEVGLDMYTHMLEAAINTLRGKPTEEAVDTEIRIPVTALIPTAYITNEGQRLHIYKRLFSSDTFEQLTQISDECKDRFGPPPVEFSRLIKVATLKAHLRILGAASIASGDGKVFEIRLSAPPAALTKILTQAVQTHSRQLRLTPDRRLFVNTVKETAVAGHPQFRVIQGGAAVSPLNVDPQLESLNALIGVLEPLTLSYQSTHPPSTP